VNECFEPGSEVVRPSVLAGAPQASKIGLNLDFAWR
jgi:hypothetical protein